MIKASQLRTQTMENLLETVANLKMNLIRARSDPESAKTIGVIRHDIAVVLTVITQKKRDEAKGLFEGKKHQPKDLRARKTRALRRALSKDQKALVVPRVAKHAANFPAKRFYLKAE